MVVFLFSFLFWFFPHPPPLLVVFIPPFEETGSKKFMVSFLFSCVCRSMSSTVSLCGTEQNPALKLNRYQISVLH